MSRSRLFSIALAVISVLGFAVSLATAVIISPVHVCLYALRADYGHGWRIVLDYCLAAFRHLTDLKPVYRDSYETNGMNLPLNSLRT